MTLQPDLSVLDRVSPLRERSDLSLEFEAFWRTLPRDGLVPNRESFRPEHAPRFLKYLILAEVRLDKPQSIRVRLGGTEYESRIQSPMKGQDYIDFIPEADREQILARTRLLIERPCGQWLIRKVHYARGYAEHVENTIFPLRPGPDGLDSILVLSLPLGLPTMPESTDGQVTRTGLPVLTKFIDLGAGVPG